MLYHTLAVLLILYSNIYCILAGDGCITGIDLYAGTGGGTSHTQSNSVFRYVFQYRTDSGIRSESSKLYSLPGNDMEKNEGDFWPLDLDAPPVGECPTADNIQDVCYIKPLKGNDGWFIENAITYGELDGDKQNLILISHNYGINSWVDGNGVGPDVSVILETNHIDRDNCAIQYQCIKNIYIMGNTGGGESSPGSNDVIYFYLNDYEFELPNLPGDDFQKNKADLWKISARDAGISDCLMFGNVTKAGFHSGGTDGWLIKDALVTVQLIDDSGNYALLAGDRDLNEWSDDYNYVDLTMKNQCMKNCVCPS